MLSGPQEAGSGLDPECMLDLIDLPETGTVHWDALGFGCREPFYESTLTARMKKTKKRAKTGVSVKQQVARVA